MNDSIMMNNSNNNNNSTPNTATTLPSDMIISSYIQKGLQDVVWYTSIGVVMGGLMGIVLARGGGSVGSVGPTTAARKIYTSLGGGIGLGTAWTNTSIQLENVLSSSSTTTTTANKK